jgi:hypothetical protein
MKRLSTLVIAAGALAAWLSFPASPSAQAPKPSEPVLLTSCGQSPGPMSLKVFMGQLGIQHEYKDRAVPADIASKKFKTLIIVTGSSLKGMGAAGVSIEDELKRTEALIAEAKKQGVLLIGAHVEGMARRAAEAAPGDNSDEQSIDAVCPKAKMLIVRKDGDSDGRFTKISQAAKIPMLGYTKNLELKDLLKTLFAK